MSQPQNPPVRVGAIDHVAIVVADLTATRRFYVGLLGMNEVERPDFNFAGAWFEAGGTLVHAIAEHEESGPPGEVIAEGVRISRTQHLAFGVDDAVAAAGRLRQRGVAIAAGPKGRPDGAAQTVIQDPDGYVIELVSEPCGAVLPVDGGRSDSGA